MTLRHRAAHGLKWQVLDIVGRQIFALGVFAVLARLLTPADFGLIGLVGAYLTFINLLVDQGLGTALVQRRNLQPAHLDTVFWFNLMCAVALCALTIGVADLLARLGGAPEASTLLRWASLALIINAAGTVQTAMFVKAIDFKYLTLRTLISAAGGGSIALVMALRGYGVWALIAQQLATATISVCVLWAVSPWRPSLRWSLTHLRELMSVSVSVLLTSLLWTFASRIDQVIIGRFAGAVTLGQYVIGIRLAEVVKTAVQEPVSNISMPALAHVQTDHERLCKALYGAMELHALVCFAAFGGLVASAPSLVPLVFGSQWAPAGPVLQVVAIYSLAVALSVFFHPALLASGGIGRYVLINVVGAAGAAAACLIGIQFGVRTVVALMTLNVVLGGGMALAFLHRRIQLSPWRFLRPCIVPAGAAILMFMAVSATRFMLLPVAPLWLRVGSEVAVGAVVYILTAWTLASGPLLRLRELAGTIVAPRVTLGADAKL